MTAIAAVAAHVPSALLARRAVGAVRPVGERGGRAAAGAAVPRPDLFGHRGGGGLAVRSVGSRHELDAARDLTYRQVGEGVTAHDAEGKPALAFGGQVGSLVHGQCAEAG
jgi:hypothetical protein